MTSQVTLTALPGAFALETDAAEMISISAAAAAGQPLPGLLGYIKNLTLRHRHSLLGGLKFIGHAAPSALDTPAQPGADHIRRQNSPPSAGATTQSTAVLATAIL